MRIILLLLVMASAFGCQGCMTLSNAFLPTEIVRHPDAPMLIMEARGEYLRVAVYKTDGNKLIEYGWIRNTNENIKGWTIAKYDWDAFIKEQDNAGH